LLRLLTIKEAVETRKKRRRRRRRRRRRKLFLLVEGTPDVKIS
jgi:hypothetical protein